MRKISIYVCSVFVAVMFLQGYAYSLTNNGTGIGSGLSKSSSTRLGGYYKPSQASVIEYDTYGTKTGLVQLLNMIPEVMFCLSTRTIQKEKRMSMTSMII